MTSRQVPENRIRIGNDAPVKRNGRFVLYWMTAFHRTNRNFSLQRAVELARETEQPLAILETLPCGGRWAADRHHRFALEGMMDAAEGVAEAPVRYYPFVEPKSGAAADLACALAEHASAVVTDDFPSAELQETVDQAAARMPVRLEKVDSNGLLPLAAAPRVFPRAHGFRRFLQAELPLFLDEAPKADPLKALPAGRRASVPAAILDRWPPAGKAMLEGGAEALAKLPIDHAVPAVESVRGGMRAAEKELGRFVRERLDDYADLRNHPDDGATSRLSPYLRAGHISAHRVFEAVMDREGWDTGKLADKGSGKRSGWWGVGRSAEAFLDQLVTWRELGYNMAYAWPDHDTYGSLPLWARETLAEHAGDKRSHVYDLDEFAESRTHDPLWNAAQTELRRDGGMHNYLRMLWGKKILEWTASPEDALDVMIELNNRYALDGCDPNSYSGIFWVLGRYDRAWGPERPVFGKIRFMSSGSTARKVHVREYMRQYGE